MVVMFSFDFLYMGFMSLTMASTTGTSHGAVSDLREGILRDHSLSRSGGMGSSVKVDNSHCLSIRRHVLVKMCLVQLLDDMDSGDPAQPQP